MGTAAEDFEGKDGPGFEGGVGDEDDPVDGGTEDE